MTTPPLKILFLKHNSITISLKVLSLITFLFSLFNLRSSARTLHSRRPGMYLYGYYLWPEGEPFGGHGCHAESHLASQPDRWN